MNDVYFYVFRVTAVMVTISVAVTALLVPSDAGDLYWSAMALAVAMPASMTPLISFFAARSARKFYLAKQEYKELSRIDALTGLLSRRAFFDEANTLLTLAQRHSEPAAVYVIDIDFFKRVNDVFGHAAGDAVLAELSAVLQNTARQTDVVGRLGGEEFAIIAYGSGERGHYILAERIRRAVQKMKVLWQGRQIDITVSIGVATTAEGDDMATIMARADRALYTAKRTGRNRTCCADAVGEAEPEDSVAA